MIGKFTLQLPSETVDEALVVKVRVSVGDRIQVDQPVLEIETAKATADLPSSVAGVIREIRVKEGDTIKVGEEIFLYEAESSGDSPPATPKGEPVPVAGPPVFGQSDTPPASGPAPQTDFSRWGPVEKEPLTSIRRATAEHLARAWREIPHVTHHHLADITALLEWRERQAEKAPGGGKPSLTAILVKAVAVTLRGHPRFNASIDMAGHQAILKKYCHIGVAVDTPRGLMVPVIRDADQKTLIQVSGELARLAETARNGKLGVDDLQGGTFTITNLGPLQAAFFTPIVNWPEVAILGIGRGSNQPAWIDGRFQPRQMLPLSLSYDHRWIDGADAARFLATLTQNLESPAEPPWR